MVSLECELAHDDEDLKCISYTGERKNCKSYSNMMITSFPESRLPDHTCAETDH